MVEYAMQLDRVFHSLSDKTRRDMLMRVIEGPLSISELAKPYRVSFAAIAKHVQKLEAAGLITKKKEGKKQIISVNPHTIQSATQELQKFEELWERRLNALEALLKNN